MILKKFQKRVLDDLGFFLDRSIETGDPAVAYREVWMRRGIDISDPRFHMRGYVSTEKLPFTACIKVPTGGGKTFIGINAIKTIIDRLPADGIKAVVWLVPSETILTQTLTNFRASLTHPYAKQLAQVCGNVTVYDKEMLLNGVAFNRAIVQNQLSVMVLSYDSFRSSKKEILRSTRENSQLMDMSQLRTDAETEIPGADPTSLIQNINKLNPIVIVDESHHAKSALSEQMLQNFNPRFVLELTATPKDGSNVISCANAIELKREHLIKLPVILYNLKNHSDLLATAISLRACLETKSNELSEADKPVRPIVLLQAQPKTSSDSVTFEKIKQKLIDCGIDQSWIAIKTANRNDLAGVDLASGNCPIRFIITVNALKEGWDCPNAYILVSLANKTSRVDVEQIVGRVLRQPYAQQHPAPALNLAYVLTSSNDFQQTVNSVVDGLQNAGFSKADYYAKEAENSVISDRSVPEQTSLGLVTKPDQLQGETANAPEGGTTAPSDEDSNPVQDMENVNTEEIAKQTRQGQESASNDTARKIMEKGGKEESEYKTKADRQSDSYNGLTSDMSNQMKTYYIRSELLPSVNTLRIPMFGYKDENDFLGDTVPLEHSHLMDGFKLATKDATIDISRDDTDVVLINGTETGEAKWKTPSQKNLEMISRLLATQQSVESRKKTARQAIIRECDKIDSIETGDLKRYVDNVLAGLDQKQLDFLLQNVAVFVSKLKQKIQKLADEHRRKRFEELYATGLIVPYPCYAFPDSFTGMDWSENVHGSLYTGADLGNSTESSLIRKLTGIDNIRWWHRNPSRTGFRINGPLDNHFPDFIICAESGKIVLIETKGEHLKGNDDTQYKQKIGEKWASLMGASEYAYYMVYKDNSELGSLTGVYSESEIVKILSSLR